MNEEEKEVLLEDLHVHQNYLAQDRHDAWFEEQRAIDASWRAAQKGAHSNAQIVTQKPSFEEACIS
jgi:hypothetical protein